jgi:hypothetical protein
MKFYAIAENGEKIIFEGLPRNTYFLAGFDDIKDAGKAYVRLCFSQGRGVLTPLRKLKDNGFYIRTEFAGKDLREIENFKF